MKSKLGGTFSFPKSNLTVNRMGYGAMQLAGPGVYGPPKDPAAAAAVLRRVIEAGVNHIDTSDYYGPHVTNKLIIETLHPYRDDLVIVTKVGARRTPDAAWVRALSRDEIVSAVHDNLRNLALEHLDIVNLRMGDFLSPLEESVLEPLCALVELKKQGLVRHIGLSTMSAAQIAEAQTMTDIVCVQNCYNIVKRDDDSLIDSLAKQGIAYVPYFPLGGFTPLQSEILNGVAAELNAQPMQVALAWLLQRSPNMLLIPGTSSLDHLQQNLHAADIELSKAAVQKLDAMI